MRTACGARITGSGAISRATGWSGGSGACAGAAEDTSARERNRSLAYSAFGGGRLLDFLIGHHVDTLVVSGGDTDVCVLSTMLSAIHSGYRINLVQDALCSSSDESHDAILGLYYQRFDIQVGVAGLEQILGLWQSE